MSSTMVASFSRELFLDALKNEDWNVATAMFEAFSEKCYKVLNEKDEYGYTALLTAVMVEDIEVVKYLLRFPDLDVNTLPEASCTPLMLTCMLNDSVLQSVAERAEIEKPRLEMLKLLLGHPNIDINIQDDSGWTALVYAVRYNCISMAKLLLAHPSIDVNCGGFPVLGMAANACYFDLVDLLLTFPNIDVNAEFCGETPLLCLTEAGHIDLVMKLLSFPSIDVNLKRNVCDCNTALQVALVDGKLEIASLLIAHPGLDVNQVDKKGNSYVALAAAHGHIDLLQQLLACPGVDLRANTQENGEAQTAILAAVYNDQPEALKLLLARPDTDIHQRNDSGDTLLMVAVRNASVKVAKIVVDYDGIDINEKDCCGYAPLHMAAGRGFPEIVQLLLDSPKFVDINATCNNGNTVLHFAISCYLESQSVTIAKMVIARPDFHINARNKRNESCLYTAMSEGDVEVARLILAHPAFEVDSKDINIWNIEGGSGRIPDMLEVLLSDRRFQESFICFRKTIVKTYPALRGDKSISYLQRQLYHLSRSCYLALYRWLVRKLNSDVVNLTLKYLFGYTKRALRLSADEDEEQKVMVGSDILNEQDFDALLQHELMEG